MPTFYSLLIRLAVLLVVGGCLGFVVYTVATWWGCRKGRRRLRVIEQDLATEIQTNGSHVRSLSVMFQDSPNDSGVFKSLDE